jgi:hypothetical protein
VIFAGDNLKALEGVPCLAEMPTSDGWGDTKEFEGPFHLTPEGILLQPYRGGYDGTRPLEFDGGVLFRWPRMVAGAPEQSVVSFTFGHENGWGQR